LEDTGQRQLEDFGRLVGVVEGIAEDMKLIRAVRSDPLEEFWPFRVNGGIWVRQGPEIPFRGFIETGSAD